MSKTAYIGKHLSGDCWVMQLIGFNYGEVSDIYAEVKVLDEQALVSLAEDFLYDVAHSKDMEIKPRQSNVE